MRARLAVSADPVVMLEACLQEAATAAGVEIERRKRSHLHLRLMHRRGIGVLPMFSCRQRYSFSHMEPVMAHWLIKTEPSTYSLRRLGERKSAPSGPA